MNKLISIWILFLLISSKVLFAQNQDKSVLFERPDGYYQNTILKGLTVVDEQAKEEPKRKSFKMDLNNYKFPNDPDTYTKVWHGNPVSQGNTSTCWCYAATSFYESEAYRNSGKEVKLSEMYTVFWEYVERTKYFIKNRGKMFVGEGSETNAVGRMMSMYGIVPYADFPGKPEAQPFHTHEDMFAEIKSYLYSLKQQNAWNEEEAVATVKKIMTHHMGALPTKVTVGKNTYSPKDYATKVLKLNPDDYVNVMSLKDKPYMKKAIYNVPDNWWMSDDYYNVPLDDFMKIIKDAINNKLTVAIGGDVSEAGFDSRFQAAVVPTFDIPSEYINEDARLMRFLNQSTTDDHAMHLVGYVEEGGKTWFLVKDSGSGSRSCGEGKKQFGYYFFHEDYIKLKIMTITLHKDGIKEILKKM